MSWAVIERRLIHRARGYERLQRSSPLFQRTVVALWEKDGLQVRHELEVMMWLGVSLEQRHGPSPALGIQYKMKYLIDLYGTLR